MKDDWDRDERCIGGKTVHVLEWENYVEVKAKTREWQGCTSRWNQKMMIGLPDCGCHAKEIWTPSRKLGNHLRYWKKRREPNSTCYRKIALPDQGEVVVKLLKSAKDVRGWQLVFRSVTKRWSAVKNLNQMQHDQTQAVIRFSQENCVWEEYLITWKTTCTNY